MKRLLLIRPECVGVGEYPPYNLVRLASYYNGETQICDLNHDGQLVLDGLLNNSDYVGVTTWGNMFPAVKCLCDHIRSRFDTKIIVGGPGVTASPGYAMSTIGEGVTYVSGDGEHFMLNLSDEFPENTWVTRTPFFDWKPQRDLQWNLIDWGRYVRWPGLPVETSRGCPFNCVWCTAHLISGKQWRPRGVDEVVTELIRLHQHFNCRTFYFPDDNATVSIERWRTLLSDLVSLDLDSEFHVPEGIQAHHLDRETLQLMKKAGFRHVTVGAESGVQRVLDKVIDKGGLKVEQTENVVRLCRELGLGVNCFFVIGTPGESLGEMEETVRFAQHLRELGAYSCMVRNAIPIPGTRMFREAVQKGQLTVEPERLYDMDYVHRPEHLMITGEWTPRQVMELVDKAKRQDAQHILRHKKKHVIRQGIRKFTRDPRGALRRVKQLLREAT